MSTTVEIPSHIVGSESQHELLKSDSKLQLSQSLQHTEAAPGDKQAHPLHQLDLTIMKKFYEACVAKMREQMPWWKPSEWQNVGPMPSHMNVEQPQWGNPMMYCPKQKLHDAFVRLARETGEPMVLLPNFEYTDLINFERFLQALKVDGMSAIGKYKHFLNSKDTRKYDCIDMVVVHARLGVLLFEVRECEQLDHRRRARARAQLKNARECFEKMGRLIAEAHGWTERETRLPVAEFVVLPNVEERPLNRMQQQPLPTQSHDNSSSSTGSANGTRMPRHQLGYLIKQDLENSGELAKWWHAHVVEPRVQQQQQAEADNKVNKFDLGAMNCMLGLMHCVRNNLVVPVVQPAEGGEWTAPIEEIKKSEETGEKKEDLSEQDKEKLNKEKELAKFQPALNLHAEYFLPQHEPVRSLSKVVVLSQDAEKLRKTVCMQIMWLLLNDSQKKISVVCSELNKHYYEEYFARQRKLYNSLNNVRFYVDTRFYTDENIGGEHTLRKSAECWLFDCAVEAHLEKLMGHMKDLTAFWVFTTQNDLVWRQKHEFDATQARIANLDEVKHHWSDVERAEMPWLNGTSVKLPLRLTCDLLIIGDLINPGQIKLLYKYLKNTSCINHSNQYQPNNVNFALNQHIQSSHRANHNHQQQQFQQLNFSPIKKFRSIKFIRGGTIENLRSALKMHDSINAPVVFLHAGDEDLFKTRNALACAEHVKELATLVKEYCPHSFAVLSTLMRRASAYENQISGEVNKEIVNFCKQGKETGTLNCYFMLNAHFEPEQHTQEGRALTPKGVRLYADNLLFTIDYFMVKKHSQA